MFRLTRQQISASLVLLVAAVAVFGPMVWRALHPHPPGVIVIEVENAQGS
jgi:hypothetical protein